MPATTQQRLKRKLLGIPEVVQQECNSGQLKNKNPDQPINSSKFYSGKHEYLK
jgi:hypothetical protein